MAGFSPIQPAFNGGEVSGRVRGRVDLPLYRVSLERCENWMVMPQGSLLRRAGSFFGGEEAEPPRLIQFRPAGATDDYILALTNLKVRVYSKAGLVRGLGADLVTNGHFFSGLTGWTTVTAPVSTFIYGGEGYCRLHSNYFPGPSGRVRSSAIPVGVGLNYALTFKVVVNPTVSDGVRVRLGTTPGGGEVLDAVYTHYTSGDKSFKFTASATGNLYLDVENLGYHSAYNDRTVDLSKVELREEGAVIELVSPWTTAQIGQVYDVPEPAKSKVFLLHPNVAPQAVTFTAPSMWALAAAVFTAPPAVWAGANWPSVGEMNQGRLVVGATPNEPYTVWGSVSGNPLDFTTNPADPAAAYSKIVTTKGALRWLRGQKALLIGDDNVEHSAQGTTGIITAGDIDIRDESAFGSAATPARHIGDEVLFVTRDRRHVRAMSFSLEEDGWVSRALTFVADHLTKAGISEIHFARSPVPVLAALVQDGSVIACTYDKSEKVVAWWRVNLGAVTSSLAVADSPSGSELWVAVTRAGGHYVERVPLHESSVVYADSAVSGTVAADGTFGGLAHLEGETVQVVVDGVVEADQVVAGGAVDVGVASAGLSIVVGLPYVSTAKTLPLEGGNPAGTSQGRKVHYSGIFVRLNESASPKLNGERAGAGKPFGATAVEVETLVTADLGVRSTGVEEGGQITVEQDLPLRTEVCAIFTDGTASIGSV